MGMIWPATEVGGSGGDQAAEDGFPGQAAEVASESVSCLCDSIESNQNIDCKLSGYCDLRASTLTYMNSSDTFTIVTAIWKLVCDSLVVFLYMCMVTNISQLVLQSR